MLPLVIGIWGMVVYQFFSFGSSDVVVTPSVNVKPLKDLTTQQTKVDTIVVDYRDPFLGKLYSSNKPKVVSKPKVPKPEVKWPQVIYKGLVASGNNTIYLVIVDGANQMYRLGDNKSDLTLKTATDKSLTFRYQGEQKEFALQQ